MTSENNIRGTMALLGTAAAAVVAALLGGLYWYRSEAPKPAPGAAIASSSASQTTAPVQSSPQQQAASLPSTPAAEPPKAEAPKPAAAADAPKPPSFDVVRVEPNGDSVIAGRAAPGATIELLRGDQVHARGVADASGLFAIVPPPLPPGTHQVVLQSIAPDGARERSRESVTVVIDTAGTRPLVALSAPDKPTVLLSSPQPPEPKPTEQAKAEPAAPMPMPNAGAAQPAPQQQANAGAPAAQPAVRPEIKIASVDTEGGRLFVSGQSAPGATIRLYLNESFIAPGGAGGDGKVSFAIASGVKSGDYRVRLDDVDPVSGQVKSRAEVGFTVPVQVASAEPDAPITMPRSLPGVTSSGSQTGAPADVQAAAGSTIVIPNINTAIVSRGDNLWRISQRIYGRGIRYTEIYGANQEQIRNPHLIYPGQVFVVPGDVASRDQEQKTN